MNLPGFLNRLLGKASARTLDAAGGGRRWRDDQRLISAGALHRDAPLTGQRAAHFVSNTAIGARIQTTLVSNIIGTGIKPRSQHPDKSTANVLNANFADWTDRADAEGRADFFGLEAMAASDMITFGDCLFVFTGDPLDGAPQLRRLHPEQLDRSVNRVFAGGSFVTQGIEFDRLGRPVAYWIRPGMGETLAGAVASPARVPASDIIHGFRPIYPGQLRGISWLAPILLPAHDLDRLADAIITRAKVSALHSGFIRDASGSGAYSGEQHGDELTVSMEPGAMITLPAGKDIEFPNLPDQGGAADLMKTMMRQIAAGVGATYEQLTGDYSEVNYSSARAGLIEFRRFAETVQYNQIVFPFCRPVWRRFVAWQAFQGEIDRAAYAANPQPFEKAKWLPPAWAGVDPVKDAQADEIAVNNRFKSRAEVVAERGFDVEDVDADFAADTARPANLPVSSKAGPKDEETDDAA